MVAAAKELKNSRGCGLSRRVLLGTNPLPRARHRTAIDPIDPTTPLDNPLAHSERLSLPKQSQPQPK